MSENINDKQYILHYKVYNGKILFAWNPHKSFYKNSYYDYFHAYDEDVEILDNEIHIPEGKQIVIYDSLDEGMNIEEEDDFTIYFRLRLEDPSVSKNYDIIYNGLTLFMSDHGSYLMERYHKYSFQIYIAEDYYLTLRHGIPEYYAEKPLVRVQVKELSDRKQHYIAFSRHKGTIRAYLDGIKIYDSENVKNKDAFFIPSWEDLSSQNIEKCDYQDIIFGSCYTGGFYFNDFVVCKNFAFYRYFDFDVIPEDIAEPIKTIRNVQRTVGITVHLNSEYHNDFKAPTHVKYHGNFTYDLLYHKNLELPPIYIEALVREVKIINYSFKYDLLFESLINIEQKNATIRNIELEEVHELSDTTREVRKSIEYQTDTARNYEIEFEESNIIPRIVLCSIDNKKFDTYYILLLKTKKEMKYDSCRDVLNNIEHNNDTCMDNLLTPIHKSHTLRNVHLTVFTELDKLQGNVGWNTLRNLLVTYHDLLTDTKRSVVYGLDKHGKNPHIKPMDTFYNSYINNILNIETKRNVEETWYLINTTNIMILPENAFDTKLNNEIKIKVTYATRRYIKTYSKPFTSFIINPNIQLLNLPKR